MAPASKSPRYVQRIARLPQVLERLLDHPEGLPLDRLAAEFAIPAEELREDLMAFFTADVGPNALLGLTRPDVLEFLGPDGDDVEPGRAEVVRIVTERPTAELGVEYVDASELALVFTAARALLDLEPANADLASAVDVLTDTLGVPLADTSAVEHVAPAWHRPLQPLQRAVSNRQRVRISYSRAWQPGVSEHLLEPYQLVQTRRGWEVDARRIVPGEPGGGDQLRTYLLSNVRSVEVLEETFDVPDGLAERLAAQRRVTYVEVVLPHAARWAADMYADDVEVVRADEESVQLRLGLLPPLERRVGMLLLAAGPDAFVVEPAELVDAGVVLAEELLVHHDVGAAPA